ncbi:hypothetical protein P4571_07960 [Niallia alba]|uniref:hypothetical protein n=1 Tax=Niallia alba TaxID=2729105 RepID=UPI002E2329B6|nr:hypothetical protein [Niallia alba]
MALKEGKSRLMVNIEDSYKEKIQRLADKEERSVSNYLSRLLKQVLDEIEEEGGGDK